MTKKIALLVLFVAGFMIGMSMARHAQSQTLTIGMNLTEAKTMDPARNADYVPPLVIGNVYDTLITVSPLDLNTPAPRLAKKFEQIENGWRFYLRDDVTFADGSPMTAEDVKFSIDRLIETKDQPAEYASNIQEVLVIDNYIVEILLKNPGQPTMLNLVAPAFSIYSKRVRMNPDVTNVLNQTSYGSSAYKLVEWKQNSRIVLERNDEWWGGKAPYRKVEIRHIPDASAQFLALRRGDIDIAMNLTDEQLRAVNLYRLSVAETNSLDFVYMTLSSNAKLNPALGKKEVRQAIAFAIDYDGLISGLIGGHAVRPPSFIPVGIQGVKSTDVATLGYNQNYERAMSLLRDAGYENGFEFDLAYVPTNVVGTNYELVAQKIRADLLRIGIRANLKPMEAAALRTAYREGSTQSVITFWDPDGPEADLWISAAVGRVARRVGWDSTQVRQLAINAAIEEDVVTRVALYRELQRELVDQANLLVLMQPKYRLGVSGKVQHVIPTPAGWRLELRYIKPKS